MLTLFEFAPYGGDIPHFTSAYYGRKYTDKYSFYSEGIAFYLAEMWDFRVSKCRMMGLKIFFCEILRPFTMG